MPSFLFFQPRRISDQHEAQLARTGIISFVTVERENARKTRSAKLGKTQPLSLTHTAGQPRNYVVADRITYWLAPPLSLCSLRPTRSHPHTRKEPEERARDIPHSNSTTRHRTALERPGVDQHHVWFPVPRPRCVLLANPSVGRRARRIHLRSRAAKTKRRKTSARLHLKSREGGPSS